MEVADATETGLDLCFALSKSEAAAGEVEVPKMARMMRGRGSAEKKVSTRWIVLLCVSSFLLGRLFTNRLWSPPETNTQILSRRRQEQEKLQIVLEDCKTKRKLGQDKDIMGEVSRTHEAIQFESGNACSCVLLNVELIVLVVSDLWTRR
ncbi:Beta-1,3-galactosyltransferase 7 [Acorus calamus]|uniref:Beta-1,3-galactosyltransferase 7 n=1 Tax=Acorus calamus TaxID=4465 RepID=A0AAV9DP19_ACOCL|nr:Beta-1,3-galactosyltransferase 7 [Acorus calamus]